MPGTIHVSVLDFVGLELSSPLFQGSIKVSMGKREYQTVKNRDLYIPLTSLRDRLVVTIQDAEGNEVSHTWIETRMVIEKGIWDDLFPLQGGGFVHMRLQFVLSEEDRNRIRTMRELALRKKHEELLNGKGKIPDSTDTNLQGGETLSQTGPITTNPSMLVKDVKPEREDIAGTQFFWKADKFNDLKNTSSANPILSMPDICQAEVGLDSSVESSKCRNTQTKASSFRESLPDAAANDKLPAKLNRPKTHDLENQRPKLKTPPHVRKMITAYESGINQDAKPKVSQPQMESQSNKHGAENSLRSSQFGTVEKQNGSVRAVTDGAESVRAFTGATPSLDNRLLKVQSSAAVGAEEANSHTEVSSEVSKRMPTNGRGHFPGIKFLELVIRRFPFINLVSQRHYLHNSPSKWIAMQNSRRKCIHGVSADWNDFQESSGFWIFADSRRHLCVTTGGKQLFNLMGHDLAEEKSGQTEKISSSAEDIEEMGKIRNSTMEGKRTSQGSELGNSSSSGEGSRGPAGQVMRIAIMTGFAMLVLFARQRTDR